MIPNFSEFLTEKEVISINPGDDGKSYSMLGQIIRDELTQMGMRECPRSIDFRKGDMPNFSNVIINVNDQRGALLLGDVSDDAPEIDQIGFQDHFMYNKVDNRTLFWDFRKREGDNWDDNRDLVFITRDKSLGDELKDRLTGAYFKTKGQIWNISTDWVNEGSNSSILAKRSHGDWGDSPDREFDLDDCYVYEVIMDFVKGEVAEMTSYEEIKKLEYYKKILDLGFVDVTPKKASNKSNYHFAECIERSKFVPRMGIKGGGENQSNLYGIFSSGYLRRGWGIWIDENKYEERALQSFMKIKGCASPKEWNEGLKTLHDILVKSIEKENKKRLKNPRVL